MSRGRQTAPGSCGVSPASAHRIASGHQSLPCSALSACEESVGQMRASAAMCSSATAATAGRCARTDEGSVPNSMGGVVAVPNVWMVIWGSLL